MAEQATSLAEFLDQLGEVDSDEERVSFRSILDAVGNRSFGPILLTAGLITLAPVIGDIPGMPTLMGILVFLTAAQVLARRDTLWFPGWMLDRSVAREKLKKALKWFRKPARIMDRAMRPRLRALVQGPGAYLIALFCLLIAAAMPPMELVPFTANGAGIVLVAFGLSLLVRDGLIALIGLAAATGILAVVVYNLI